MKKNSLLKPVLTIIIIVIIVGVFVFLTKTKTNVKEEIGQNTSADLESNINIFMEAMVTEDDLGKDNYHCANSIFGQDDKYVYAWVYCAGFAIKVDGSLEMASASSGPNRFEYIKSDFKIITYTPGPDGENDLSVWKNLFPGEFYEKAINNPSSDEIKKLEQEVKDKAGNNKILNVPTKIPSQAREKPPIVDHFACSDYCPGPQEQYMVKIYQGITDSEECKKLGGKASSYMGWTKVDICIVQ